MQNGSTRYTDPSELIGYVNSTTPDMWFTFQPFILVKDKNPAYSQGGIAWDCTSSNPALHWTNDNERYCYDDFKAVVAAIAAKGMKVTDPLSVGIAYGRPATYPASALSTGDTTPPSDPTNFQASATSSSSVALAWDASTDNIGVTGYRVERSTDQTSWTSLASLYTGTSYVDATAAANTQYYYSVSAVDAAGNVSGWATAAATTPQAPPPDTTPPTMPSGFVATPAADRADVSLVWDASTDDTGVTSYCVERSTDQSNWTTLSSNQTARTFTDSSATYSTQYYYRVSAVDAAANRSDYSTTSVVTSNTRQYVANQSLEGNSATGWASYSSTSAIAVVKVIGDSKDGSYALRVTNSQSSTGVAGLSDKAPRWVSSTVANRTYTGSMWLSGTPNTAITVQLRECTVTGSSCPALARVRANLPVSGWVQATVTYQARSNNNQLRFSAFGTLAAKDSFLADAFSITSPIS